ncbi:MAG: NAD(P)-dependent oxidoreductase [Magnetococcales bacterium]|nr:NAD(P)-dependent oxidoreductase [Magnetococcales bacterium]
MIAPLFSTALLPQPVLVTGASGIVGANLVHRLAAEGVRAHLTVRPQSDLARLRTVMDAVVLHTCDLTDREQVHALLQRLRPATIFHLASTFFNPPTLSAEEHYRVNLLAMLTILEALREQPTVRFIWTGTAGAYDSGSLLTESAPLRPGSLYGCSKAAASQLSQVWARLYAIPTVELRLFTPYGPWERRHRLIPHVILSALAGQEVRIGDGRQQRDFVYMQDVVEALLLAASKPLPAGAVFNICSGEPRSLREVVSTILELMGNPVPLQVGVFPPRADEIWEISGDNQAAANELAWRPQVTLQEGLQQTIAWFRHHQQEALALT